MSVATILVVDDDATTCRQLRHLFEAAGWKYRETRYASDALRALSDLPDGFVLDMAQANAEGLLEAVRARALTTFVVALVGSDGAGHLRALESWLSASVIFAQPADPREVFKVCDAIRRKADVGSPPHLANSTELARRSVITTQFHGGHTTLGKGPSLSCSGIKLVSQGGRHEAPSAAPPDPWITEQSAAARCGVTLAMIRLWVHSGAWPLPRAVLASGAYYRLADVQGWLDTGTWPCAVHFHQLRPLPEARRTPPEKETPVRFGTSRVIVSVGEDAHRGGAPPRVHHQDFPEISATGASIASATVQLCGLLTGAIASAPDRWHRRAVAQAKADVDAFVRATHWA